MNRYTLRVAPLSAFGSELAGDMLFGQLCWALREAWGSAELERLLDGYTAGLPFAVVSDPMPPGHWPRPSLPPTAALAPEARKRDRARRWVDAARAATLAVEHWPQAAVDDDAIAWSDDSGAHRGWQVHTESRMRNSIDRLLDRPSEAPGRQPYASEVHRYPQGASIEFIIELDDDRLPPEQLRAALEHIGLQGYGRDASTGLGKFMVHTLRHTPRGTSGADGAHTVVTLGPCAPAGQADPARSFYRPRVRFGRHGASLAAAGAPYKAPVILAAAGAVLRLNSPLQGGHIGRGLGGDGSLSLRLPTTVHQGYAPVVACAEPRNPVETR